MPCSGRDPAQALGRGGGLAPAHRLGPGEGADDRRDRFGEHRRRSARPGLSTIANRTPSRSSSWSRVRPVLRRKPSSACGGRRGARALGLLADRLGLGRQAAGDQGEAARRGVGLDRLGARPALRSRSNSARDRPRLACIRAGISSERSSRRKSVIASSAAKAVGSANGRGCRRRATSLLSRLAEQARSEDLRAAHHAAHPFLSIQACAGALGEVADAADIGLALGDRDHAARLEQC